MATIAPILNKTSRWCLPLQTLISSSPYWLYLSSLTWNLCLFEPAKKICVSLPALLRWRKHTNLGCDEAGSMEGIERSMIFPRERHRIWWEPWGRWCYVRTSVDLHAVAFQVQCCFLLSLKFDEEVIVSFLSLFALSLSLFLSISWNLYLSLCQNYLDVGKLQIQGMMGPGLWWAREIHDPPG